MKRLLCLMVLMWGTCMVEAQITPVNDFFNNASFTAAERVDGGHSTFWDEWYYLTVREDTTLNSLTYKKVFQNRYNHGLGAYDAKLLGLLRVDGEKVYYNKIGEIEATGFPALPALHRTFPVGTDIMLYNFDLNIGDTLHWRDDYPYFKTDSIMVVAIDSVTIQPSGQFVKRYIFSRDANNNPVDYWLRGPGGNRGLFSAYANINMVNAQCYFTGNGLSYYYRAGACYPYSTVGDEQVNNSLELFPQPVSGTTFTLVLPHEAVRVSVYDMISGRQIYTVPNMQNGKHTMPAPEVPGVYIVSVTLPDGVQYHQRFQRL